MFNEIYRKIEKSINYYSHYLSKIFNYDFDDARQEIAIRVWKSIKRYDNRIGSYKTYFVKVIRTHVKRMIKESYNNKHENHLSLDSIINPISIHDNNLQKSKSNAREMEHQYIYDKRIKFVEQVEENDFLNRIEDTLIGTDRKIFNLLREFGWNLDIISRELRMSQQSILNRIRRKIKPICIKKYLE